MAYERRALPSKQGDTVKKMLIVMRHGKAMPPAENQLDEERCLTEAGKAALEARLPYMLSLFEAGNRPVQIWASPAKRARQTAELLEAALRESGIPLKKKIKAHDSLWEQDIDAFLDELRTSKSECIFAVGHIPFAEDIVDELTGATPSFSPGALGCLTVRFADEDTQDALQAQDKARLLWFVQGPVAADWDTLIQLQATLTQVAEAIEDRHAAFFATPDDIETIHRFRTNIRTLRSLLAFIKPWQNAKQNAETQAILKEVVRHTSRLRELDVLVKQVHADQESSPKLIAFCEKEAAAERAKVLKILASKAVNESYERAIDLAKNVTWKKRYTASGLSKDVVRARFDALVESAGADIAAVKLDDAEHTHDVRKRAKRARYVAEFCTGILGEDAVEIATGMTAHQDTLGDVCDARASIRLTDEFLHQKLPKSVKRDLAQTKSQSETLLHDALEASKAEQPENS